MLWWETFLFVAIVWNFIGFMIMLMLANYYCLNPKDIWNKYENVNIFGCVLLTIFLNLLVPTISIGYWFYKLCTVGRR